MSGYDKSKDRVWWSTDVNLLNGGRIEVAICSYDGGPWKLSILRWSSGDKKVLPLGRLTSEEAQALLPAYQEGVAELAKKAHAASQKPIQATQATKPDPKPKEAPKEPIKAPSEPRSRKRRALSKIGTTT